MNKLTHGHRTCCICEKPLPNKGGNIKTCLTGIKGVKSACQNEREARLRKKYKDEGRRKGQYVKLVRNNVLDVNAIEAWRYCIGTKCKGNRKFYSPSKFVRQCERCKRLAPDVKFSKTPIVGSLILDDPLYKEFLYELD
jgi:hypothetical protein